MSLLPPSSESLEHAADVRVRVRAASFGELAAEAGRALAGIQLGSGAAGTPAAGAWREIAVAAPDRVALLVDWLNELIYLAEAERWVAADFQVLDVTDSTLRVRARGVAVAEAPARVKAATFSGLVIRPAAAGLEAELVFDV